MSLYNQLDLKIFCQRVFERLGVESEQAYTAADALVRANLEGVDSHGISRLAIYAKRMKEGRIQAAAQMTVEKKGESVLLVDGDHGLGQIVASYAVKKGMELAKQTGLAAVAVKKSNHFGTASYYCQMACEQGFGMMAFTNSPPGIPPWGGKKAFFGTNPIAFGFPTRSDTPVIIDMSTSVVARGKIILAAKQGQPIPKGWAINEHGEQTEDAEQALRGAVLPLGGAKGYALALAIEILTGVLSGAAFGPHVKNMYEEHPDKSNIGHLFILFDISKFMDLEYFTHLLEQFLEEVKSVPLAEGVDEIFYPGERRAREYKNRLLQGISLSEEVERELYALGESLDLRFPAAMTS
ncbi:Ldh family oxidoreductase [Ammoniphilus sp. CFH 90114]|uniref:Ldh family oxidoreductase n=1 Tax=Ammoniphilus sp. CFH 90114 TaxID=2493665 RepID=UPI00100E4AB3|nr:Ldh family oxidoreductase [Ammoniphilus sp. CFH 90114]RXT07229.1 Ldh family oxidoreductase [Ammoniphilus sp. CFH 90114]